MIRPRSPQNASVAGLASLTLLLLAVTAVPGQEPPATEYAWATAYAIPKELTNIGEGYFSIVPGLDDRLYIGACNHGLGAYLVEFNPRTEEMRVAVDAHKAIGITAKGFAAQAKIHTRNNVGESGRIYCATKQGYPDQNETRTNYPGGYPIVYDPKAEAAKVYDIVPIQHSGVISITPDESRGVAYLSTCSDERPNSTHFLILNLKTGKYRDLGDLRHMYAFIVIDHLGRAYHPVLGGEIARYDPKSGKLERLKQTIDGKVPTPQSGLTKPTTNLINWDIAPDRKTLYAVAMDVNQLYAYDLTAEGDTIPGRSLGPLITGAKTTDCRNLVVGPTGEVWAALLADNLAKLASYKPGDTAPVDRGVLAIRNQGFTKLTDDAGKSLPAHHAIKKLEDGTMVPLYPYGGITQAYDRTVYVTTLAPYTLLKMEAR